MKPDESGKSEDKVSFLKTSNELYTPAKLRRSLHTVMMKDSNGVDNGRNNREPVSMPPVFQHFTYHQNYQHLSILPQAHNDISNATDTIISARRVHHAEKRLLRRFGWEMDKEDNSVTTKEKDMDADSSDESSTSSSMQEGISERDENFVERNVSNTENSTSITDTAASKFSTYPLMTENKVVLNVGSISDSNKPISSQTITRENNNEAVHGSLSDRKASFMKNTHESSNYHAESNDHTSSIKNSDGCNHQQKSIICYTPKDKSLKAKRSLCRSEVTLSPFVKAFIAMALGLLALTFNVSTKPNSVLTQRSAESSTLAGNYENLADVSTPLDPSSDIPLFWHVPAAAGVMVQSILGHCFDLVQASHFWSKGYHVNEEFRVEEAKNIKFINIDTDSLSDMNRARYHDLVGSNLADIFISPRLQLISTIFTSNRQGRLFTLLPHPLERAINTYYGLVEHNEEISHMTLEEYATSSLVENNWLTRALVDERGPLTREHVEKAKEILQKKCIVGLANQLNESVERFIKYFNWNPKNADYRDCKNNIIDGVQKNREEHVAVEEGSELWFLLLSHNTFDMEVYRFAEDLFKVQETELFSKIE